MENKYVCPKCGGKLVYWITLYSEKIRTINPKTGVLSKTIKKGNLCEGDTMGFRCTKCGFEYYGLDCSSSDNKNHDAWAEDIVNKVNEQL